MSSGVRLTLWGEGASLAFVGHPSSNGITIKMLYVVDVYAYPFFDLSDLTCHFEDVGIGFSGCIVLCDSNETKLGSSNQEASPSAGKNTGIVLVYVRHGTVLLQLFLMVWISKVPNCHLL